MALFTAENAKAMSLRAAEARRANFEAKQIKAVQPDKEPEIADEYRRLRLARVRRQLDVLDRLMSGAMAEDELDAAKLDRLASAAIRLNEQERQLSNRSLPPTVKAPAGKVRRSSSPEFSPKPIEIARPSVVKPTSPGVSTDSPAQSPELPPL